MFPSLTIDSVVGGIDRDGTGAVYSFDPVGSYERESCRAAGAAQSLVQPFLDNMVSLNGLHHLSRATASLHPHLCLDIFAGPRPDPAADHRPPRQVYDKNQVRDPALPALVPGERPIIELEKVLGLVTDAFTGATERHIEVRPASHSPSALH